jgi:oxaloacetate decarboxylase alpha subunit
VLTGDRYKTITKESAGILKGEYGATPAPVNQALQTKVLASIISFSVGVAGATTSAADFIEVTLPPADTSTL